MVNIFVKRFGGFEDRKKKGKFKHIKSGNRKTFVMYMATFKTKQGADKAKAWYKYMGANHARTYKTSTGYEVWGND